jgi:hypothetical protein
MEIDRLFLFQQFGIASTAGNSSFFLVALTDNPSSYHCDCHVFKSKKKKYAKLGRQEERK